MIQEVKLIYRSAGGSLLRSEAVLEYKDGRIWFLKSPFALKDEIKAMEGSKWHGYDVDEPQKIWSVKDSQRNRFQLGYLQGEDVYAWFDQEVKHHEYTRPLRANQTDLADHFLTYHYGIMAAEMGLGKTLAAQEVMERSGIKTCWWIGPLKSLPNIQREFRIWNLDPSIEVRMLNYEALPAIMKEWEPGTPVPQLLICDECSRCKGEPRSGARPSRSLPTRFEPSMASRATSLRCRARRRRRRPAIGGVSARSPGRDSSRKARRRPLRLAWPSPRRSSTTLASFPA